MNIQTVLQHWPIQSVVAIVAGIVILVLPRLLNYAIATYLIVIGTLGLLHSWYGYTIRPQTVIALVAGILILLKPTILNYVVGFYLILIGLLELGVLHF